MPPITPTPRRHRAVVAVAVACVALALTLAGACSLGGGSRGSIEAPTQIDQGRAVAAGASDAPASDAALTPAADTPAADATTPARNPLLAPPPTDRPDLGADGDSDLAPVVSRVATTDRVVFITIDDGQVRDPAVLDRLGDMGVPFTSFLTEPLATADPPFWKGTQASWGMVETHTINHPNLRELSGSRLRREVCEPADTVEALFGRRPTLFRPPYGNSSDSVRRVAKECGYDAVVLWTGSTNNGRLTMQQVDLRPGDIILMHYRDTLLADLADVVARATAEGFTIGRLQDYLSPGR